MANERDNQKGLDSETYVSTSHPRLEIPKFESKTARAVSHVAVGIEKTHWFVADVWYGVKYIAKNGWFKYFFFGYDPDTFTKSVS